MRNERGIIRCFKYHLRPTASSTLSWNTKWSENQCERNWLSAPRSDIQIGPERSLRFQLARPCSAARCASRGPNTTRSQSPVGLGSKGMIFERSDSERGTKQSHQATRAAPAEIEDRQEDSGCTGMSYSVLVAFSRLMKVRHPPRLIFNS